MKSEFDPLVQRLMEANIFLPQAVEILERKMMEAALKQTGGNQSEAAKQLGVHRNTLQRKMVEYQIDGGRSRARRKPAGRETRARRKRAAAV
ncbi:MAG TPA: helix-turn-helix domain-containing protein [Candidatus Limnocylindrales bacterium]|nr:helix-turn-helix domain-containing protein [Candidatus Limnocylindrales bacterium]